MLYPSNARDGDEKEADRALVIARVNGDSAQRENVSPCALCLVLMPRVVFETGCARQVHGHDTDARMIYRLTAVVRCLCGYLLLTRGPLCEAVLVHLLVRATFNAESVFGQVVIFKIMEDGNLRFKNVAARPVLGLFPSEVRKRSELFTFNQAHQLQIA